MRRLAPLITLLLAFSVTLTALIFPTAQASPSVQSNTPPIPAGQIDSGTTALLTWSGELGGIPGDPNSAFWRAYKQPDNTQPDVFELSDLGVPSQEPGHGAYNRKHIDSISVDPSGAGIDIFVTAWESEAYTVKLHTVLPISNELKIVRETIVSPTLISGTDLDEGHIRLAAGDIDGQTGEELVVAYQSDDGKIQVRLYDLVQDGRLVLLAAAATETPEDDLPRFFVTSGDYNGDGADEIGLVFAGPQPPGASGDASIYAVMYDYDPNTGALQRIAKDLTFSTPQLSSQARFTTINLVAASGDFNNDDVDELVVTTSIYYTVDDVDPGDDNTFVYAVSYNAASSGLEGLDGFDVSAVYNDRALTTFNTNEPLSIDAYDLDGDGRDEIALASGTKLYFYETSSGLNFTRKFSYDTNSDGMPGPTLETADLVNRSMTLRPRSDGTVEIILALPKLDVASSATTQTISLFIYKINNSFTGLDLVTRQEDLEEVVTGGSINDLRRIAVAAAGSNDLALGVPALYERTEVVQPLVILKAPPTHYDILDGDTYDVSDCFRDPQQGCPGKVNKFTAFYESIESQQINIDVEINRSTSVEESLGGKVSVVGVTVEGNVERTHGEETLRGGNTTRRLEIRERRAATLDDVMLGTVVDYQIWEYPIIKDGATIGYFIVVDPASEPRTDWFSTKSWTGYSYIPDTEVGNVLSYATSKDEISQNSYIDEALYTEASGQIISYTSSANDQLEITYEEIRGTRQSLRRTLGLGIGVSAGFEKDFGKIGVGVNAGTTRTYAEQDTATHTVEVKQQIKFTINFGNINSQNNPPIIEYAGYRITPYIYWANNGALVLDYVATPENPPPGQTSWWVKHYGTKPDAAFLLPWRLDNEKGFATTSDRPYLTKDIVFDPPNAQAGEEVTIVARIHNYSLNAQKIQPKVRFYVGDPDDGGTLITGVGGETEVTTDKPIGPREHSFVSLRWKIPDGLRFPRIYAVIDPDNQLNEIHENNNKAYAILGSYDNAGPPIAAFDVQTDPDDPLSITFYNQTTGQYTETVWDFGDGSGEVRLGKDGTQLITHTYARPGTYTVTMEAVGGPNGETDRTTRRLYLGTEIFIPMIKR